MFSALATSPVSIAAESSAALFLRPKTKGKGSKRETYTQDNARYMNDFRPAHEKNKTLLSVLKNNQDNGWIKVSSKKIGGLHRIKEKQTEKSSTESFPELPIPQKPHKPLCWVSNSSGTNEHMKPKDEFKLAPVPESAKVKNKKDSMQVLSKTTTNDAIDSLNFQEKENTLREEVKYWKEIAESRGHLLDEMESKIISLNRELDDMYERYC